MPVSHEIGGGATEKTKSRTKRRAVKERMKGRKARKEKSQSKSKPPGTQKETSSRRCSQKQEGSPNTKKSW